ncbi:Bug family tripartite tricarboxylate transporter substrate binding protein [Chloroflexota bacterium]
MKKSHITLSLLLIVVLIAGSISCAQPAPAPAPAPKPAPAPAPKPAPAPAPKPAPAPAPKPAPAPAPKPESPAEFYAKNTVSIVCPYGAGGATDFAARLLATFWSDAMGGAARVDNKPGGGSVVGANYLWNAKPDGLTFAVVPFGTTLAVNSLFKAEGVQFDISKFNYIGMYFDDPWTLAIGTDLAYNSVADLQKVKGLKLGTTSKVGGPPMGAAMAIYMLGLEGAAAITGYTSTSEVGLAIARGEIDGMVYAPGSVKAEMDKGYVKPIVNIGFIKSDLYSDVPPLSDVMTLNPEQEKILGIYTNAFRTGKVLIAPPGVSADKVDFVRDSFDKIMELSGFQRHAKARYGTVGPPTSGKDVLVLIQKVTDISKADLDKLNELTELYVK